MPITEVARFTVPYLQILDEKGNLDEALDPRLSDDELRRLYHAMVLARQVDERMLKLQRQGRLGTFPPTTGHEAIVCAAALAMRKDDWMVGAYRELGARLMRGEPLELALTYFNGLEEGNTLAREARTLPQTVILASQLPHAVGIAYAARQQGEQETAVVTFFGDGATSQGDFHEALNFAGVWKAPVVFICQNNQWAISVPRRMQTASETIAQKAIGYGVQGVQVDGNDALAVYRATREALDRARRGEGPTLIEAVTYRLLMHTTADDPGKYRDEAEAKEAWGREPLPRLRAYLERRGLWTSEWQASLETRVQGEIERAVKAVEAPRQTRPDVLFDHVLASSTPALEAQRLELLARARAAGDPGADLCDERPRVTWAGPLRPAPAPAGSPKLTMVQAINLALRQEMARDPRVVVMGEDVGKDGGVFRVTDGLLAEFGPARVMDTPLAESGIVGTAIGMALAGLRPVPEMQFCGFSYLALPQIEGAAARYRQRSLGTWSVPMVLRMPYGGGVRALEHHSESRETLWAHLPGLKVVIPSGPRNARALLLSALRDPDPVIFMEPKRSYRAFREEVPEAEETLELGRAQVVQDGKDVTLIGWGAMMRPCLQAVAEVQARRGASVELIDLLTISPLDHETILDSVRRTGRVVIAQEAPRNLGVAAEVIARINDGALLYLEAPVKRVTGFDVNTAYFGREQLYFPDVKQLVQAIEETLDF